jgi:hypothetical protein
MHRLRTLRLSVVVLGAFGLLSAAEVAVYRPHDFVFKAAAPADPFAVELLGVFTGPDGSTLRVPGFYDGTDTWKIRFMAPAAGQWQLRTVSSTAALHGKEERITASANNNPNVHGLLRVDADHPYHFRWQDGTRFFLMGYEADWLGLAQMDDPQRKTMHRLIEQMHSRGFNYVLANVYAHDTRWAPGKSCEWDYGPPAMYAFGGTNAKPDHKRLNIDFFKAHEKMMYALWEKGIVVQLMIKVYNKDVNWPAPGSEEERRYFRHVVARYQAFPNVVWDFSKESFKEPDNKLQKNLIDLIRSEDAYKHLTVVHDDDSYEWDPVLSGNLDFRTDQQHSHYAEMVAFDRAMRVRPVVNVEFGYEYGVEKLPTHAHRNQSDWKEHLRRAYVIYFAGGYGAYYYNNTAWDVVKPDPEPPGMQRWQILKQTLSELPYWRMSPCAELAVGGPGLCDGGRTRAFYLEGGAITLNLRTTDSEASGVWVNTWTGDRVPEATRLRPAAVTLRKPQAFADAPAVLIVAAGAKAAPAESARNDRSSQ